MGIDFLDYIRQAESLDEILGLYSQYQVKVREINWVNGDVVRITVDRFGDTKPTYGKLAEVGMGTIKHLQQIERVARAFKPAQRDPVYPWSLYRAAYQAAKRTDEDPYEVLCYGLEQGWHSKDFASYGRPDKNEYVLKSICPMCGFKFSIVGNRMITANLLCPICESEGEHTLLPGEFERR
jgi:rubrerythrin